MNQALNEVVRRWGLTAYDRKLLVHANPGALTGLTVADQCLDIDRALLWLLGDRETARQWLRRPHPAFYHTTPLQLVLGSRLGRETVRAALLSEAAGAMDTVALAVLGERSS